MSRDLLAAFQDLHDEGHFVIPNAWDVGSARILEAIGFRALATTSSGLAAALGRNDQEVGIEELVAHVEALVGAVQIPVSVDAEYGFAASPDDLGETVARIGETGAVGMSIEDYIPERGILEINEAVERVASVVEAAEGGLVVTARAENHLYGVDDIDDTIMRLKAYESAGADVLYAPFLSETTQYQVLVHEVATPINALLRAGGPTVGVLADVGVRRMSTGGALAFAAYGALEQGGLELLRSGTSEYAATSLSQTVRTQAFEPRRP